ncbi:MAG: 50S ribosomal protein L23 [bacterium]|nr:50S ribosomal protein L23 [bacterium]
MALFNKTKKEKDETKKGSDIELNKIDKEEVKESVSSGSMAFSGTSGVETHKVLRGFYVSEKASMGIADNQYMFKVFNNANKSEVKKEVSKLFKVEVKSVKILNMPEKRRDFGKHPGSRSGFKKAIVILKSGYTIGQAKP